MIRPTTPADLGGLKAMIDQSGLFPAEMLDEMIAPYFTNPTDHEFWLTDDDDGPVGVAYCAPERMTNGTWNLLLIVLRSDSQGKGRGSAILQHIEQVLRVRGERLLLIETSGLPAFEQTRAFYLKNGYTDEARIRDFYQAGEDKIVFRKAL